MSTAANVSNESGDEETSAAASDHRVFVIRPWQPDRVSSRTALIVVFSVTALEMLAFLAVALFVPLVRILAAIWFLFIVGFGIYGIPRIRRMQRGLAEKTALWLTEKRLGYTDWQGAETTCSRSEVQSAWRLLTTIGRQTRDMLVFTGQDGRTLISTPLQTWRPADIDSLTAALGIRPALRKFINSEAELKQVAPGLPSFAAANRRRFLIAYGLTLFVAVATLIYTLFAVRH